MKPDYINESNINPQKSLIYKWNNSEEALILPLKTNLKAMTTHQ